VIWMTFAVGLAFQFPLILILLIKIGMLSVRKLRESRRLVLVILMVSAALITPGGDPVSLCILTIPLYFLFEMSILVGTIIERKSETAKEDSPSARSITGSMTLLLLLITTGGGGAWLYFNWEKTKPLIEKFLPASDFHSSPAQKKIDLSTPADDLPFSAQNSFILELTPIDPGAEKNVSISAESQLFKARVKP
ncbi:MAG: hypothetical protein EBY48_11720, partial [Opitutae bacterium]|nr:hypothetical protein [Opitutae bacterium]